MVSSHTSDTVLLESVIVPSHWTDLQDTPAEAHIVTMLLKVVITQMTFACGNLQPANRKLPIRKKIPHVTGYSVHYVVLMHVYVLVHIPA